MRPQDPVPDWTTHLALIYNDGKVHTGRKEEVLSAAHGTLHRGWNAPTQSTTKHVDETAEAVIELAGVNVSYGERKVSVSYRN